ncbi:MAG: cob(I)yrinic acid a,c-diamide adenosyltransferase [Bacteroidetes bacterium]|nr:cob(I)yrinic acid a,c-diamide adenosyltransferase [Bacteroidota bacterium]
MKIYTRTGDDGETGLFGGDRVPKSHPRLDSYGTVDETNSAVGFALAEIVSAGLAELKREWIRSRLHQVQGHLFVIGAELATPAGARPVIPRITEADVTRLETWIDEMEDVLPPLSSFILPGGTRAAAAIHLARTICRRAERATVKLDESVEIDPLIPIYLNRLSDFLFVLARWTNYNLDEEDIEWHPENRS